MTITELSREQNPVRREIAPDVWMETGVYETLVTVEVMGETPKLEGWKFLGTLDHAAGDTVVRNVPGASIPDVYWGEDRVGLCDHCGAKRHRKETFVVENDTGETKQVGRQCVADFLGGKSVEAAIALASWLRRLGTVLDDEDLNRYEYGDCLWREPVLIDSAVALSTAIRVVNEHGFLSRSKASDYDTTTSDRVMGVLWPLPIRDMSEKDRAEIRAEITRCTPNGADKEKASTIRDWILGLDAKGNSYINNLQVILKREMVQPKEIGLLTSAVPFYFREIENPKYQPKDKASGPVSEHIGQPKDRLDIEVECVGISSFMGDYGETIIYRFKSGSNKLTWFSSSGSDIEISMWAFESPVKLTHILAHEMGHHLWYIMGRGAQSFWSKMVSGDLGKLDLRKVVKKYKTGWIFDNKKIMKGDPFLYYQLMGLEYGLFGKLSKVNTIEELQEYLDEGGDPVITVKAKPVSGYANKNATEAFCEAIGLLVAYGPRTVHPEVVSWLNQILPGLKVASGPNL